MNKTVLELTDKLINKRSLSADEYEYLIENRNKEIFALIQNEAVRLRKKYYSNKVFIRGLIEISNICKNDCYYCGIRKSNKECSRYRLTEDEILCCCENGYKLGFRTFVLQGGEDAYFTDERLCKIISEIKSRYNDCAVTLSLGERSNESYQNLHNAGSDRYLLRHETADSEHYSSFIPNQCH